jgi:hypothetical protein
MRELGPRARDAMEVPRVPRRRRETRPKRN